MPPRDNDNDNEPAIVPKIELSDLTPYQTRWARAWGAVLGAAVHSIIALITYAHCKNVFTQTNSDSPQSSISFDVMMNMLYFTVIDAVLSVLQLNRAGVRIWHWKINFVIAACVMLLYFSNALVTHALILCVFMIWVYKRITNDPLNQAVMPVGLEKYMTGCNEDYFDVTWPRNYKYLVITAVEVVFVWRKSVWFFSPLLFVFADAIHNRMTQRPRTKISDWYVSIFTASMDTGLWMSVCNFQVRTTDQWMIDIGSWLTYLAVVEVLVRFNDKLVKDCHAILHRPARYGCMVSFILFARLVGSYKHTFAIFGANLVANMLFVYMSTDIAFALAEKSYFTLMRSDK